MNRQHEKFFLTWACEQYIMGWELSGRRCGDTHPCLPPHLEGGGDLRRQQPQVPWAEEREGGREEGEREGDTSPPP